jgi:outer membrane receptor protein involved in Fe transport
MYRSPIVLLSGFLLILTPALLAQGMHSQLTGTVTSEGSPLPGVTVTVSSPALLGTRTTVSGASGQYFLAALPPGPYDITFSLSGMTTVTRRADLKLAETSRVDAALKVSAVAESITVTATTPSVLETPQVSTNIDAKLVEQLPLGRTIRDRIQIAAGVQSSGTNGQTVINGAQSFDNLYLVNGVVVNENLRGQPDNAVIEEAIQETTLLVGGVSAEYGRFTGGVISTITKSGGNDFSGSLRDNMTNDKWIAKTDFAGESDHIDKINSVYEVTLGGRFIRDRLWFFAAGRKQNSSLSNQTQALNIPFTTTVDQKRYEGKLTGNVTSRHTLIGSYLSVDDVQGGTFFGNIVDLTSLRDLDLQIRMWAGHYNGVITNNLLVEAQYSQKDRANVAGSEFRDRIFGTMVRDTTPGTLRRGWSPTFCGTPCPPKERNNMAWGVKSTYFLSTATMGSHNLVAGFDEFHELRNENNYQSGSDFRFFGPFQYINGQLYIHADPTPVGTATRSRIQWDPLLALSETADLVTDSLYINDKWALGPKWSFNLGVRYDQTSGKNQARVKTSDDSRISPRLGAIYDVLGDGKHRISVAYGRYAAKIDGAVSDQTSPAGRYATYLFKYEGPELNKPGTPVSELLPTDEVLRRVFGWFDSVGGTNPNSPLVFSSTVPGLNIRIDEPLQTPYMDEITLGYGTRIGGNGYVRADLIHRTWGDFYVLRRDLATGKTPDGRLDVGLIENGSKDDFERNYNGVQVQGLYRFLGRFNFGGNYTWSKLRGNVEGEEFNNATIPVGVVQPGGTEAYETPSYPEYTDFAENRPVGYLMGDIRHRANLWVQFDVPIPIGQLSLSALERYHSGQSYSATAPVAPVGIANPGYARPPSAVQYYFSERGAFRLDDITSTDVNATYTFPITKLNLFVKADVINVFNEQGVEFVENPNSTAGAVINRAVTVTSTRFNPKTETPVLGTHYTLPATFGQPTNKDAYQMPRQYRFAVGVRF